MDNLRPVARLPGRGCEERTGEEKGVKGWQEVIRIFSLFKGNRFFSEEGTREENCPFEVNMRFKQGL